MLTGDKSYISDEFYDALKKTGLVHVMAVSGLHISIICTFFLDLLKRLKVGSKPIAIIGFALILLLMAVAGFTGSVKRAGFMFAVVLLSRLFSRRADALNSLGVAVTVLSLINPYTIFGTSFMLSALGTLGILLFGNKLNALLSIKSKRFKIPTAVANYIIGILSVSLCASVTIIPVSLFKFSYISVISPVVNIIVSPIVWLCIISALFALFTSYIPLVGGVLLRINAVAVYIFKTVIEKFADYKYAVFYKSNFSIAVLIIAAITVLIAFVIFRKYRIIKILTVFTVIVAIQLAAIYQINILSKRVDINFFNANGNLAVLLSDGEESLVITDTNSVKSLNPLKEKLNSIFEPRIRAVIVLNGTKTSLNSAKSAFKNYDVYEYTSYSDTMRETLINLKNDIRVCVFNGGNGCAVKITISNYAILIDTDGTVSDSADFIFTENPALSYKIHKHSAVYLTLSDASAEGYINSHGGNAFNIDDNISFDNLLKFIE